MRPQFLTQPFVVGDSVRLLGSGGGEVVAGVVESVDPMNTIVRMNDGVPVIIPNSVSTCRWIYACQDRRGGAGAKAQKQS